MTSVRPAAVAGAFYPGSPKELDATVQYHLSQVANADAPVPKAIIAPHAGYIYSGPVAATAYARVRPAREVIKRVVLLGPCHRVPVRGLAVSGADAFATPLGDVPVDRQAIERILDLPQVEVFDATHEEEHSLEVHLPFLQVILEAFSIVPLVVGEADADKVAEVLERLWGGPETLIVISTDLSHYLEYDSARRRDRATCRAIEALDGARIGREDACGRIPMNGTPGPGQAARHGGDDGRPAQLGRHRRVQRPGRRLWRLGLRRERGRNGGRRHRRRGPLRPGHAGVIESPRREPAGDRRRLHRARPGPRWPNEDRPRRPCPGTKGERRLLHHAAQRRQVARLHRLDPRPPGTGRGRRRERIRLRLPRPPLQGPERGRSGDTRTFGLGPRPALRHDHCRRGRSPGPTAPRHRRADHRGQGQAGAVSSLGLGRPVPAQHLPSPAQDQGRPSGRPLVRDLPGPGASPPRRWSSADLDDADALWSEAGRQNQQKRAAP